MYRVVIYQTDPYGKNITKNMLNVQKIYLTNNNNRVYILVN